MMGIQAPAPAGKVPRSKPGRPVTLGGSLTREVDQTPTVHVGATTKWSITAPPRASARH